MPHTRNDVKLYLKEDKERTLGTISLLNTLRLIITQHSSFLRWRYIFHFRWMNYYKTKNNVLSSLAMLYHQIRRNKIGNTIGYEIGGVIGKGLALYHNGPIVINGNSIIGDYCSMHGDICIGNDGITEECPIIGNYVDIGVGAKIIGNVKIADKCRIGAGAVVISDFLEEGSIIVGVPAKKV